ncbi:4Fe-4S binding protein [bacterium]|nr:4Fe-4S binding protein [bacterium]
MKLTVRHLRKATQSLVLVLLVLVPVSAWRASHPASGSAPATPLLHGDTWSMNVFGLSFLDPLGGLEALVSGHAAVSIVLAAIAVPVLLTVLLGRVFCSWICPAGFLFEMGDHVRARLARLGVPAGTTKVWRGHKYVLLGLGVLLSALVGIPLLSHLYPPALLARELHGAVFDGLTRHSEGLTGIALVSLGGATLFLLGILMIEMLVSRRFWCRSVCPGGALYSALGSGRSVRVRRFPSRCTDCAECIVACPMGLDPMRDHTGVECDNCQECIVSCPDDALRLSFSRSSGPVEPPAARTDRTPV